MVNKYFKNETVSIKQRFIERKKLLKPFIDVYGNPVLVHSVDKESTFKKILLSGKLKLPKEHSVIKKTPYMEKMLKIDNGIYYSLGFVYATAYGWKYNLIFDLNFLKDLIYYDNQIIYQCYKSIIDYWYEEDREYLEKLANTNKECRKVVNKYYNEEYGRKKRVLFDFWKIEKDVFNAISKYPNQKEIKKRIKRIEEKYLKKFPSSKRYANEAYLKDRTPEVVGLKENDLLKNKNFIGFYIRGKISKDVLNMLKKKYPGKILFDGVKIQKIL